MRGRLRPLWTRSPNSHICALAMLVGAFGLATPAAAAQPVRVTSLNECSDQLVLALAKPTNIASVT